MKKILVLCTGNSCRSQMAQGYLAFYAKGKAEVYSGGIETHGVNPRAIEVMREDGIDIAHHTSNLLDEYYDIAFDYVITVCDNAKENCPFFPSKAERFHQNFPDPVKSIGTDIEIINEFRSVRQMIKSYSEGFINQHFND
ncbi:arsenate reductase ArsC [Flavobacterium sp. '19STA2R22 D10 B1']|uniref:arsenate reductase ArsC n=1 Tax=Flavobacterium aerium TaxID=3037261 RepID=UPI00278C13C7|nr:arsenate reductase ArsC [Flavobacterium sp. '19STA2R22 D10 B1']